MVVDDRLQSDYRCEITSGRPTLRLDKGCHNRPYSIIGHFAIRGEIGRLICFDIKREQAPANVKLRSRKDAPGQFEVIADVEELDHVLVITGELQKSVRPRGNDTAAELKSLGDRA